MKSKKREVNKLSSGKADKPLGKTAFFLVNQGRRFNVCQNCSKV